VVSDSIPELLDTEFISPSTIRALVPAYWLTGPGTITIRIASAQDPQLTSDGRALEILNTVGIPLEPVYPAIGAVNDGFVPLPPAGTTSPVKLRVTGEGFQPGAEIVASVEGEERHLPTTVQSAGQIQADLPADFWAQRNFTVSLVTETQTAQQGTNPPAARVQVPQGKASFEELKLPRLYDQGGLYSHYKPRKGCFGFHAHKVGNGPLDRSLMVPVDVGIGNGTRAKVDGSKELFKQGLVSFVVDSTLAKNSPEVARKEKENHDVQGLGQRRDAIVPLKVQQKNDPIPFDLGSLGLQLMPTRRFVVNVHFITTLNGGNKSRRAPNANDTEKLNKLLADFTKKINEYWEPQTRVYFRLSAPATWPEAVDYDKNGDGKLNKTDKRIVAPDTDPTAEVARIVAATVPLSERDPSGNPKDGSLHLYFVREFLQTNSTQPTLGFAAGIGTRYLFVQDEISASRGKSNHIIAHELGHSLGLLHNTDLPIPANDSDAGDTNSLMWFDAGPGGCHIGLHHWQQLNAALP
jgi:hypothetical protein